MKINIKKFEGNKAFREQFIIASFYFENIEIKMDKNNF